MPANATHYCRRLNAYYKIINDVIHLWHGGDKWVPAKLPKDYEHV